MLLQSAAMEGKNLLVDDKITACVKQICLVGVISVYSFELSGETFCFLDKRLV